MECQLIGRNSAVRYGRGKMMALERLGVVDEGDMLAHQGL